MSIRTVVVDDEKPARERIKRFLSEHPDFELVGEAGDGESAVRLINETRPDLVFLDVRMPEADGFEVLERCDPRPRVVFATAYERYAVQAFEVASIDYLLKPFDRKRFAAALARVREEVRRSSSTEEKLDALLREIRGSGEMRPASGPGRRMRFAEGSTSGGRAGPGGEDAPPPARGDAGPEEPYATASARDADAHPGPARDTAGQAPRALSPSDRIPGKRGTRIHLLAPGEVLWFEADGELVFARAGAHRYLVSRTLAELEASLDPRTFFRSHRSFIVNLSAIGEIVPEESGNYRIIMRDAERTAVPLSRRQARKLRDVFPW